VRIIGFSLGLAESEQVAQTVPAADCRSSRSRWTELNTAGFYTRKGPENK